jgi:hypothetical protein
MRYRITLRETNEAVAEFELTNNTVKPITGRLAWLLRDEFILHFWRSVRRDSVWRRPENEAEILKSIRVMFGRSLYDIRPVMGGGSSSQPDLM